LSTDVAPLKTLFLILKGVLNLQSPLYFAYIGHLKQSLCVRVGFLMCR